MTLILAIFTIYSFSVLNANFYSDKFETDFDPCDSLVSCFTFMINVGLRNGGGVADSQSPYEFKDSKYESKLIFDLAFFVFINIISLNIIFGIIIDTFGEMRGENIHRSKF